VTGLTGAAHITAGPAFACALLSSGSISCWGVNDSDQVGPPQTNTFTYWSPITVSGVQGAIAVAAGGQDSDGFNCVVLSDRSVECWGDNSAGELGATTQYQSSPDPVLVSW
jgi:alpha-tubulin suppressor-like RCC1 family protein